MVIGKLILTKTSAAQGKSFINSHLFKLAQIGTHEKVPLNSELKANPERLLRIGDMTLTFDSAGSIFYCPKIDTELL